MAALVFALHQGVVADAEDAGDQLELGGGTAITEASRVGGDRLADAASIDVRATA